MKHLKVFEAFQSKKISTFVNNTQDFLNKIQNIMSTYDIDISRIEDDSIHYERTSDAFKKYKTGKILKRNKTGVRWLKYFFDINGAIMGATKTTDKKSESFGEISDLNDMVERLKFLKENNFHKVWNYRDGNGKWCCVRRDGYIAYGYLYKSELSQTYFLSNSRDFDGNSPGWSTMRETSNKIFGNSHEFQHSWSVTTSSGTRATDHDIVWIFDDDDIKGNDTLKHNEIIRGNLSDIQKASYALIFDMNKISKMPNRQSIRDEREERQKDVLVNKDPKELSEENWQKRIFKILSKYGVLEGGKRENLEKLILHYLTEQFALSIICGSNINNIDVLASNIRKVFNSDKGKEIEKDQEKADKEAEEEAMNRGYYDDYRRDSYRRRSLKQHMMDIERKYRMYGYSHDKERERIALFDKIADALHDNGNDWSTSSTKEFVDALYSREIARNSEKDRIRFTDQNLTILSQSEINDIVRTYKAMRFSANRWKKSLSIINKQKDNLSDNDKKYLKKVFTISNKINRMVKKHKCDTPGKFITLVNKLRSIHDTFKDPDANPMSIEEKNFIVNLMNGSTTKGVNLDINKLKEFEENIKFLL